ncbi:hypothetical protein EIP91_000797 [Steccherinum ochraceum]|uniref:Uncharacterized protein n=1 Tax=Steccherinum ochraceum TaxID=92696 RepID=A0A4R0RJ28_9APHY|nr:hypothetical protein EIP91_000797 [Steccherinum ochraceum]
MCSLSSDILGNQTLAALVCSGDPASLDCTGICANPDLAGIGVRVAFYAQSVMNTLLVVLSPRDSVPSAWAGTLLTASLIIAAIVQKIRQSLTLHHATLILNFATLSCISSLASAPMLPIWRLRPHEYYAQELARHAMMDDGEGRNILESEVYVNRHKSKIKAAQNRERVVLSLALLTQVVLQWAWGIIMFVSPSYSGSYCSGGTIVLFFLAPFRGEQIDIRNGFVFAIWPLWLMFSLGITLALTIVLALSSPNRAHDYVVSRQSVLSTGSGGSASIATPVIEGLIRLTWGAIPAWNDRPKQLIFWGNIVSCALWLLYLVTSEWQRSMNCIFEGENDFGGFGQVTAVLLSLAPLWSLTVAIYKYPSLRKRQERRHLAAPHVQRARSRSRSRERVTSRAASPSSSEHEESRGLLHALPSPPSHSHGASTHDRFDSGATAVEEEAYEMGELVLPVNSAGDNRSRGRSRNVGVGVPVGPRERRAAKRPPTVHVVTIPSPDMGLSFTDEGSFSGTASQ